ncbi:MAG: PorV/PorQ family protein [Endomicrobiales bacterium]|nr:PorV/PorQ family protein [Endomicrobiales bacterium]
MNIIGLLIISVLFITSNPLQCYAGGPGTTASNFLKFGVGARPIGLGGAFCAVADDVNALYWNPGGLAGLDSYDEVTFMHNEIGEEMRYEYFAYSKPVRQLNGTLAASLSMFTINNIQGYSTLGAKTSLLKASNMAFNLGYGKFVQSNLMLGASFKYISETLDGYKGTAYAVDAGAVYKLNNLKLYPVNKLNLGFVVQNIGTQMTFIEEGAPLPFNMKLGVAFKDKVYGSDLVVAYDMNSPSDNDSFSNIGVEYRIYDLVALRFGYQSKDDLASGVRGGIGFRAKSLDFDYALLPRGDFGNSHRISVTFRFGMKYDDILAVKRLEQQYERGVKYYERGDMINAYREFKGILSIAPGHKKAQEYLAKTELRVEEIQMKEGIAEHLKSGEKYFHKNNLSDAQSEFEAILAVDANHKEAKMYIQKIRESLKGISDSIFRRGLAYYEAGEYNNAIKEMNKVLTFDPDYTKAREYIGLSEEKIQRLEELRKQRLAEEEERMKEKRANLVYAKAMELYEKKDWKQSFNQFQEVLSIDSGHKNAKRYLAEVKSNLAAEHFDIGKKAYDKKELETALKNFNEVVKYDSGHKEARQLIDKIVPELKKQNQAKAMEYNKQGLVAYAQGKLQEAIKLWKEAVKLDPSLEEARSNIKRAEKELSSTNSGQ